MISKQKFVKYMNAIKKAEEKEATFEHAICSLNKGGEGLAMIYSDEITTMIEMVCELMGIEYNYNENYGDEIQFFIYESNWGKNENLDPSYPKTLEELYDDLNKQLAQNETFKKAEEKYLDLNFDGFYD